MRIRFLCVYFGFMHTHFFLHHLLSVPDEKSWKAEAEIDMELFHQVEIRLFLSYFYSN